MYDQSWDKTLRVRRPLFRNRGDLAPRRLPDERPAGGVARGSEADHRVLRGRLFTPPPKTIKDITAILDAQKPDAEVIEKRRETADAKPPPGMRGAELAKFLWKRGLAAGKIGDARRQLADMKEAAPLSKGADQQTRMDILFELGVAELGAGTRALLVSNWPAETTSARILTTRLFAAQAADAGLSRPRRCAKPCSPSSTGRDPRTIKARSCSLTPIRSSGRRSR